MTWVKVCGLTNSDDVAAAIEAGADAIGFVNVPTSPRYVSLQRAAELAGDVPGRSVLLTLDLEPGAALRALAQTGISGIQPYGAHRQATAAAALAAGRLVLFPTHPEPGLDLANVIGLPLLDTPSNTKLGGTGRSFDWALAENMPEQFVLAGGLGPHNVVEAIERVHPWGVDASSRLERAPGKKDHSMVADFINKAKMT
jgi:phosphoribosylanthranilate isomerase